MKKKLVVFDTHPVQYRVPIWRAFTGKDPVGMHVVYGSDCSVRGYEDEGFGETVVWDDPMLEGYAYTILDCEQGIPFSSWNSLNGKGVGEILDTIEPKAVLLTGLNYQYDMVAYVESRRRGIPLWLRCETQDEATHRSSSKSIVRSVIYNIVYRGFDRIFYIGQLNRRHYLRHGVPRSKLISAPYGTINRFASISDDEKYKRRAMEREKASISNTDFVIGFSGKLISKKNPEILFRMLETIPEHLRSRTCLYFVGSGELEQTLRNAAEKALHKYGVRTYFTGFVNQSKLASHYLVMDVMVLPSRRMGETWGLVVNEAMQAGCGVIVSDAVGCSVDFKGWERFKIFSGEDAIALSKHVVELSHFPTNLGWATRGLQSYSIDAVAETIKTELESI